MRTAVFGLLDGDEPGFYTFNIRIWMREKIVFPLFFEKIDDMPSVRPRETFEKSESGKRMKPLQA